MRYQRSLCHAPGIGAVLARAWQQPAPAHDHFVTPRRWITLGMGRVIHDQFVTRGAISLSRVRGETHDHFVTQSYRSRTYRLPLVSGYACGRRARRAPPTRLHRQGNQKSFMTRGSAEKARPAGRRDEI
jgi:hypothetical protein